MGLSGFKPWLPPLTIRLASGDAINLSLPPPACKMQIRSLLHAFVVKIQWNNMVKDIWDTEKLHKGPLQCAILLMKHS